MYLRIAFFAFICFQQSVNGVPSTKKCVAHWKDTLLCDDFDVLNNVACWYNWDCNFDKYHVEGVCNATIDNYYSNFASMIWGVYPKNNYSCHHGTGSIAIMGANEPNHHGQSNRSPAEVAAIWPDIEANANGKPIISPSAAHCGGSDCWAGGNETVWFDEFFWEECSGCNITYLATHTYWCNVDKVMKYLEFLYDRYGKKIWLTEFSCSPNKTNKDKPLKLLNFLKEILPRLEAADFVDRYFYYMSRIVEDPAPADWGIGTYASLFEANSSTLTRLGQYYNDYEPS